MMRGVFPLLMAVLALAVGAQAGKFNKALDVGDAAPAWTTLPGVDGKDHALTDYESKTLVIVFTCNGCPVSAEYQGRMNRLAGDYSSDDVTFVSINANPGQGESLEKMTALSQKRKLTGDYLKDADQTVAKAFGARATPTVFLLDRERRIIYMGAIDDNWEDEAAVEHAYLRDALVAALAGDKPEVSESRAAGCAIPFNKTR